MTAGRTASVSVEEAPPATTALASPPAQRPLSLRLNFSWMFVANVVYAGCRWGMLSVLAKLGTPAMVGQFVLALAITTPVMAFFMLQLREVQATDARRDYRFGDYLALRLTATALALALIAGIALASGYRRETVLVILAAAVSVAINSISDTVHGLLQRHERLDRIAQSLLVKGPLSLVALTGTMLVTGRVFYAVLAVAASRLIVLVFWDFPNAARVLHGGSLPAGTSTGIRGNLLPRWHAQSLLSLAQLSLPLGVVMMLITLSSSLPRYFVEHHLGEHMLGIFGALCYLRYVGTTAIGALGQSATPRLAQHYALGETAAFCLLLLKLAAFGALVGALGVMVAMVAGRPVLTLLYGPEYAQHATILVWVMIAAAIHYVAVLAGYGITAARRFRIQIPLFALVAAATGAACLWLVPRWGVAGAALSLSCGALVQLLGAGLVVSHAVRTPGKRSPA
jgi:O-antigen/teichoic acid export membrane protein